VQNILRKAWHRGRSLLPVDGFAFGRPLVVLQSDDWGRVGVRDREAWEELRASGLNLGERSYDFYSLETADDVAAIVSLLLHHRDSTGRPPCLGMNFIVANVDFSKVRAGNFRQIHLRTLKEGLPDDWNRPGLFETYRAGISEAVLSPALHGATHFCRLAAERHLNDSGERGMLLRTLWKAGVPYIHWRMPWIGFEYSDPGLGRGQFLKSAVQEALVSEAVAAFTQFFGTAPRLACAPGYRSDRSTHQAWARHGIRVAQNGPGSARAPHFESNTGVNSILHLYRTMDFEPADPEFSIDSCLRMAEASFARGIPAIVSVHSINFHSTLKDFRGLTLQLLDKFLSALESKHPDLLYVSDEDLYNLVEKGSYRSLHSDVQVAVTRRKFMPAVAGERR